MNNIEKTPIFKFRGSRHYLHSTTVFDWFLSNASEARNIDFQFNKLTGNQCRIAEDTSDNDTVVASYRDANTNAFLIETNTPIKERYECNEMHILKQSQIESREANFDFPVTNSATFLECNVANYKAMLSRTEDGQRGQLVFARIKLDFVPRFGNCKVKHRRKIGESFYEATLLCNNLKIGAMYFGQQ